MAEWLGSVARDLRGRAHRWRSLLRLLAHAGTGPLSAAIILNLLLGLLPIVFIVAMSVLVQRLPGAVTRPDGPVWTQLMIALAIATGAFLLQQILLPLQVALGKLVTWRVDGYYIQRLMTATLADAPISTLEDQDELDRLSRAREAFARATPSPGDAAAGVLALIARYGQLVGALLLVAVALSPAAAVIIGVTALVIRFGQRGALGQFGEFLRSLYPRWRRASYVKTLASGSDAAKEIRIFGLATWIGDRYRRQYLEYLMPFWSGRRKIYLRPFVVYAAVGLVGGALTLAMLADTAADGQLSLLRLGIAIQAVLIPMRFGVHFPESDVPTQYGLQTYDAIVDLETTARDRAAATAPAAAASGEIPRGTIRFEGVGFRYHPQDPPVLRGLDLELPVGTSTAIVGLNGAGKTTLVKLLGRLYDPTEGRVSIDGRDLRDFTAQQWQRQIAVIFQDYVRYELSAAENIDLAGGRDPAAADSLLAAARRAGALDVVGSLPAGLRTPLSARYAGGQDLSGGQWQRVALARALFKVDQGAAVMVLDEPTAQLDVRAEVEFFDRFLDITRGLTTVLISHRFSTVRRADRIAVLEQGHVVELGNHEDLLALDGRYARLFRLQAQRFGEGPVDESGVDGQ